VQPGDTLWNLAATHLGNADRWTQLFAMNRGRPEPGGRLVDPNLIYAGWTLEFPAGAIGVSAASVSTHPAVAQGSVKPSLPATATLVAYRAVEGLGQQALGGVSRWAL
jgi:hypothetical protein